MTEAKTYKALWVTAAGGGDYQQQVVDRSIDDLPEGEVLVRVQYSSLNFKDMLSASGNPAVTRNYPHQPGIDAAGVVEHSDSKDFQVGDVVIVSGYDLGMNTPGGLGQYIRVPANWVVAMPQGLTARGSMAYGTAGFTAALCIGKLMHMGARPEGGSVAVTGATGGVGSFAVAMLAKLGFSVAAVTGKASSADYLKGLGASEIVERQSLLELNRPMEKPRFAHAVDTLGGDYLVNLFKVIDYSGSVASCGLAASPEINTTVIPFIIRDINLLGVDCVSQPLEKKEANWQALGADLKLDNLDELVEEIALEQVPEYIQRIKDGSVVGRYLVNLGNL